MAKKLEKSPTKKPWKSDSVLRVEASQRLPSKEKLPSKSKRTGKVRHNRPNLAEQAKIGERRALVLDLAKTGLSFRQISAHLISKGYKASPTTISDDLNAVLKELAEVRVQKTELLVEMELEKLDDWEFQLNLELKSNKPSLHPLEDKINTIVTLLKVQDRRDRFLTLSKREKSKIDTREALAKLIGVPTERLPEKK